MKRNELRASSLHVERGGRVILDDVSLVVSSGQMLVVTGPSGSGKTTLARVLAGVIEPDWGEVTFAERALPSLESSTDHPAFVPQEISLVSSLTATETVALPLKVRPPERTEIQERCARWLKAVGLEPCANRLVVELSGGQRQRLAIARALVMDAPVIVLDEPTTELDPANRDSVHSILRKQRERGAVVVLVSHEADVIAGADLVYELSPPTS